MALHINTLSRGVLYCVNESANSCVVRIYAALHEFKWGQVLLIIFIAFELKESTADSNCE